MESMAEGREAELPKPSVHNTICIDEVPEPPCVIEGSEEVSPDIRARMKPMRLCGAFDESQCCNECGCFDEEAP